MNIQIINALLIILILNIVVILLVWFIFYLKKKIIKSKKNIFIVIFIGLFPPMMAYVSFYDIERYIDLSSENTIFILLFYVFIIPLAEEFYKFIAVYTINMNRKFNSISEGMYIGVIVGLVFAFIENLIFSFSLFISKGLDSALLNILFRGAITIIGHPLFTSINGTSIATKNFISNHSLKKDFIRSYWLHSSWNFVVLLPILLNSEKVLTPLFFLLLILMVSFLISSLIKEISFVERFDSSLKENRMNIN